MDGRAAGRTLIRHRIKVPHCARQPANRRQVRHRPYHRRVKPMDGSLTYPLRYRSAPRPMDGRHRTLHLIRCRIKWVSPFPPISGEPHSRPDKRAGAAVGANWALSHIHPPTRPANAPTGRLNGSPTPSPVGRPGGVYQGLSLDRAQDGLPVADRRPPMRRTRMAGTCHRVASANGPEWAATGVPDLASFAVPDIV